MARPRTFNMRFYECEHQGDLDEYLQELHRCGASVLETSIDDDAEEAVVRIQVPDFPTFKTAWQATDAADCATSLDWFEDDANA